jgi:hypothetical protein
VTSLRQFLPLGHNAVQHADHYPQLRQTAQVGWYAGTTTAHSQLSCLLRLVAWSAGDGHQQVDRLHVTVVHALADSGCQVLELQDRGVSRKSNGCDHRFQSKTHGPDRRGCNRAGAGGGAKCRAAGQVMHCMRMYFITPHSRTDTGVNAKLK